MNVPRWKSLGLAGLLIIFFSACDEPRELMTESKTVAAEGAQKAEVAIHMGAGELNLRSADQEALLDGTFRYRRERHRPQIDYRLSGTTGILTLAHARRGGVYFGNVRNDWDVRLTKAIPMDLDIHLGAGQGDLDLRGLQLSSVEIDMGVGEMSLDLQGAHKDGFRVKIDGGVGSGRIYLPADVGVRIKVDGGIGSIHTRGLHKKDGYYFNDAYGSSPVDIDVDVDAGIGSLDLIVESAGRVKT